MKQDQATPQTTEAQLADRDEILVAIWWPGEGYGGAKKCRDMEHARTEVQELIRLGYGKSGKHPIRIVTTHTTTLEIVRPESPSPTPKFKAPHGRTKGYSFHNPDTGWEWSRDHPIESGEVEDAENVQQMTYAEFRRQHPAEDRENAAA